MINVVHVALHHYGDWTELTESFNFIVNNPYYLPIPSRGINLEVFRIYGGSRIDVREFIEKVKNHGSTIVKVLNIIPSRNYTDTVMYGDYGRSVKSIFVENMFIIEDSCFKQGMEYYTAVMAPLKVSVNKHISNLLSMLNERAHVASVNVNKVDLKDLEPINLLTPIEREVLNVAYELGYFNYPKGADLDEVAMELNLSKSTVNYHLRNAIKKIVSRSIKNIGKEGRC